MKRLPPSLVLDEDIGRKDQPSCGEVCRPWQTRANPNANVDHPRCSTVEDSLTNNNVAVAWVSELPYPLEFQNIRLGMPQEGGVSTSSDLG